MKRPLMSATLVGAAVALSGLVLAAPAAEGPTEEATQPEKDGLIGIHARAVEVFVGRPGFGIERMTPPPLDSVILPKSLAEKPPAGKDAAAKPPKREIKHGDLETLAAPPMHGRFTTADKTQQWVVREVLLIGMVKHPEPVVYLKSQAAAENEPVQAAGRDAKTKKKEIKTRKLDTFESESVKVIQGGGGLQAERTGKAMRAVAAIYAGDLCLKCHEHEGQMLGAFAYRLERVALKAEEKGK